GKYTLAVEMIPGQSVRVLVRTPAGWWAALIAPCVSFLPFLKKLIRHKVVASFVFSQINHRDLATQLAGSQIDDALLLDWAKSTRLTIEPGKNKVDPRVFDAVIGLWGSKVAPKNCWLFVDPARFETWVDFRPADWRWTDVLKSKGFSARGA